MSTTRINDIKITFGLTYEDVIHKIDDFLKRDVRGIISTTNPEFIIHSENDPDFKEVINNSLLSVPDGIGVVMANEYLKRVDKEGNRNKIHNMILGAKVGYSVLTSPSNYQTITGVDLVDHFCRHAASKGYTIIMLGGWPKDFLGRMKKGDHNVARDAAAALKDKYPGLRIVSASSGFSPKQKDDIATQTYIDQCIKDNKLSHIDMLFVSYGSPAQEVWLKRNFKNFNIKLAIGVGGTFDYIAGVTSRSPEMLRELHLEWLYRLMTQPYRIKRIINAIIIFPLKIYRSSLSQ